MKHSSRKLKIGVTLLLMDMIFFPLVPRDKNDILKSSH